MIRFRFNVRFLCTACLLVILLSAILSIGAPALCYADTVSGNVSDVLTDLTKDPEFDTSLYPTNASDTSINVIQIAESSDKKLIVYAYQPSGSQGKLRASSINIGEDENLSIKNYKLEYVNSVGVFYKYVVKDFTIKDYQVRYYYIPSIFRPFIDGVDTQATFENSVTEVVFEVAKQYRFTGTAENYTCDVAEMETITVTDKFVGFVRYPDGFKFLSTSCDSHFVAFSTDRPIDELLEADVYYNTQVYVRTVEHTILSEREKVVYADKPEEKYAYLKGTDHRDYQGSGWGAGTYSWDRIESVETFLRNNTNNMDRVYFDVELNSSVGINITEEGRQALSGKQWLLRFTETPYSIYTNTPFQGAPLTDHSEGTIVGDVTILRLKFYYDGKIYNLGVIDNSQSGSGKPINGVENTVDAMFNSFFNWLSDKTGTSFERIKTIIIVVAIVIGLAIVLSILSAVFPPVWFVVKSVGKGIKTVITLPFKVLKAIFEKIKG